MLGNMQIGRRISHRLDAYTLTAILAAALDAWTTGYFLVHRLGVETNPILAPLVRHSLVWIPIVLLSRPLLIPLLPDVCRQAFAVFYITTGTLFAINNASGILAGSYFLVEVFSFESVIIAGLMFGVITFAGYLLVRKGQPTAARAVAQALVWIAIFAAFDGIFALIGHSLRAA
jgi:hypothetical protein